MATKSILKNIEIKDKEDAKRLIEAIEKSRAESEEGMERLNKHDISEIKKVFNSYNDETLSALAVTLSKLGLDCIDTIQAQQQEIQQHIKWNEAHTKARVEQGELIKDLKKQLQQYDADRIMEQQNCGELCKEAIELQQQIEAQQQEIEQLKEVNRQLMWENISDNMSENITAEQAEQIKALTADKDEQAGRIMRLDNGLKKLRSSLQWLKETIPNLDYKAWAEDNIGKIDALLGGKE